MKRSATLSLITIICAAYLVQLLVPSLEQQLFLIKEAILSDGQVHGTAHGEWYRLLTIALTHGGIFHLGFNMYALIVLGNPIEAAFGKERFLIIFFISLISGSLLSNYLAAANQPSVGASGAIFGLFGAMAIAGRKIGAEIRSIAVIVGINFALGFALGGVDWHAHLGGLIGGALASTLLLRQKR
jgi:membrane associated rhomboid family serine protease